MSASTHPPGEPYTPIVHFRHRPDPVFHSIVSHVGQVVLKLVINRNTLALFRDIRQQDWAVRGVT